ncbi:MAG: porin family protein [Maribacter sp.]
MKSLATVVTVLVFGLFSSFASAQYIGVRAGVGISNLLTPTNSTAAYGRVFSAHLGGTIDFDLADRFYLQSGLSFLKKGGGRLNGNFNLYYLEVPVTARFDFLEIGAEGNLYARAGLYSGMLLAANFGGVKRSVGGTANDSFRFFDMGLITGIGYAFNDSIDVGFATQFGFLNVEPNPNLVSLTNATIMITANYRFGM